jgi:regulatory protein
LGPQAEGGGGPEPSAYQRALACWSGASTPARSSAGKLVEKASSAKTGPGTGQAPPPGLPERRPFAAALARSRSSSGYGPARIRAELATHGLSREDIAAAIEACEARLGRSARGIVARRYGGKDLRDPDLRRKAVDFLLRRGFEQKAAFAA